MSCLSQELNNQKLGQRTMEIATLVLKQKLGVVVRRSLVVYCLKLFCPHHNKDVNGVRALYLMQISQKIWRRKDCIEELGDSIPEGTICGGELDVSSYVAQYVEHCLSTNQVTMEPYDFANPIVSVVSSSVF